MTQQSFDFGQPSELLSGSERKPSDQEVRDRILRELDSVMIVEASAGTGKTQILVDRMVALITAGVSEIGEVCAITYTRKAATELRERFQNALESRKADPDDAVSDRVSAALDNLDRAFIGTIHAFCARILRERPVEAGAPPGFVELEQADADRFNMRVWEEHVETAAALGQDQNFQALEEAGIRPDELRHLFRWYCSNLDVRLAEQQTPRPELAPYWERAAPLVRELEERLADSVSGYAGNWEKVRFASRMIGRIGEPRERDVVELLGRLESLKLSARELRDDLKPRDVREVCEELRDIAARGLAAWREYVHGFAVRFVVPAALAARERRLQSGQLMFSDLLVMTRDLLRDHSHVRRYFQRRYKRIFVDEFQDTDPVQTEIVFFLAGDELDSTRWTDQRPRPGSLFIVGDPKQSIYRFRRADIRVYEEVKKIVLATGGSLERLVTNFRSTPMLCRFVNDRFERILVSDDDYRQAAYSPVEAYRSDGQGSLFRRDWQNADADSAGKSLAAAIRSAVERQEPDFGLGRAPRWNDFLLITRTRAMIAELALDLEEAGVPYEVTGARSLGFENILGDLLPLLRAVADPDDQVSLVGYLRGPFCGASDDELYEFRKAGGVWRAGSAVPEAAPDAIGRGLEFVEEARGWITSLPPAAAFGRIVDRLLLIPSLLAGSQGRIRAGSVFLLSAMARTRSAVEGLRFEEIVDLFEQYLDDAGDLDPVILESGDDDRVRLMNLHQAKGLEGNVVVLTDPRARRGHPPWHHVVRDEKEEPLAQVTVNRRTNHKTVRIAQPPGWQEWEREEAFFEEGQEDRLLYVAATRARDSLLVDFYRSSKGELTGPWSRLDGEDLPALEAASGIDPAVEEQEEGLLDRLEQIERTRAMALDHSGRPSWKEATVTGLHHGVLPAAGGRGLGDAWGRAIHSVLETLMLEPESERRLLVANALRFEGLPPALDATALGMVEQVTGSRVWKAAQASRETLVEVPIGFLDGDTRISGVIDLVYREGEEWVVVDYKTDVTADRTEALVAAYNPQVRRYVEEWQRITGEPSRGVLLFLDGCIEVPLTE